MFPLKNYKYSIPINDELGSFGVKRKFDVHTGVDLYCQEGDDVYSIEHGKILSIEPFTGEIAGFPWWNNTYAVSIKGKYGIINYGEILPNEDLFIGKEIPEGYNIGKVTPVLKKDKKKVPSTSMLHLELYKEYDGKWIEWNLNEEKPEYLLDPTQLLISELNC